MAKASIDGHDDRIPDLERAFGAVLRQHRLRAEQTQEELALDVGLDRTFVSLLERGLRRPSLTTIFVLARHFGVAPSRLVQEIEERLTRERRER